MKANKSFIAPVRLIFVFLIIIFSSNTLLSSGHIDLIEINGPITPITSKYITDAIRRAEKHGAECLIIQMDTPGGLMQSTWTIDKAILADRVPVVVYIAPSGGRAGSAGVYISYSANVVAMAPGTRIGSAHPVSMMGKDSSKVMTEKITNDAVAHIRGMADIRGRDSKWAEEAVRRSVSITEKEALRKGVIDLIAKDLNDLVSKLDGRELNLSGRKVVLYTKNSEIRRHPMSWQYKILDKISDPNIAYILLLGGLAGLFFELKNPGAIFPGAIGAISLILAFFAMQVLPINAAGILLILLAILLFILEIHITSFGLLTIGGIVSMIFGSLMLFKSPSAGVSLSVIIPAVLFTAAFFIFAVGLGIRAQFRKSVTGDKGIIGEIGEVIKSLDPEGRISVHGEVWKAVSDEKIKEGEKVEVTGIKGLKLKVKRAKKAE